jgi:hypothetical protein
MQVSCMGAGTASSTMAEAPAMHVEAEQARPACRVDNSSDSASSRMNCATGEHCRVARRSRCRAPADVVEDDRRQGPASGARSARRAGVIHPARNVTDDVQSGTSLKGWPREQVGRGSADDPRASGTAPGEIFRTPRNRPPPAAISAPARRAWRRRGRGRRNRRFRRPRGWGQTRRCVIAAIPLRTRPPTACIAGSIFLRASPAFHEHRRNDVMTGPDVGQQSFRSR